MCSKIKNFKYYDNIQMGIYDFVYLSLGIVEERLKKVTHKELKKIFPNLRRTSFSTALKNQELLYKGNIILVKDSKGIVIPYVRCFKDETEFKECVITETTQKESKPTADLSEISNYELMTIYNKEKRSSNVGKYKRCRLMKEEIQKRNIEKTGKKEKIEKIRRRELE